MMMPGQMSLQEILQENEAEELKESRLRVNGWQGQVGGAGGGWMVLKDGPKMCDMWSMASFYGKGRG